MTTNPNYSKPSKIGKESFNGIIFDGKVYLPKIGIDNKQCTHCDLSNECDEYYDGADENYPCSIFAHCRNVYFRYSQPLTEKINEK